MKKPIRINYHIVSIILIIADIIAGTISLILTQFILPQANIIIPKVIFESHSTPLFWQYLIWISYWLILFGLAGLYRHFKQKNAFQYLLNFALLLFAGMVFYTFFFFVKNQFIYQYGFFHFFAELFFISIVIFAIPRIIYYATIWWLMKKNIAAIHAILIGNSPKAQTVYDDFAGYGELLNYHFTGYVTTEESNPQKFHQAIPCLGTLNELNEIIEAQNIDEVIVALDSHQYKMIEQVLAIVKQKNITIRLLPDINAILEGSVKMNNVKGIPLITIRNNLMPVWQIALKVTFDYFTSLLALIISLPFILVIIIGIKATSHGPVFYLQTRMGKNKKPFVMIKFRSMYIDAERNGPALASDNDPRITPIGRILRKWHMDEIPQFFNVLKGDMSIVGPRPERQHFVDQIIKQAPYYSHLFRIKPGITSWGMVKFGYAESVEQMIERSKFDIIYLENMTLLVDLKIIIHTIKAVFIGNGK